MSGTLRLAVIWLLLLAMAGANLLLAHVPLGPFNLPVALTIAAVMVIIVIWGFMRLASGPALAGTFLAAGFFWLMILLGLLATDMLVRPAQIPVLG